MFKFVLGPVLSLALAGAANAAVIVTAEAPGAQGTTVALASSTVETFDGFSSGYNWGLSSALGAYDGNAFITTNPAYGGVGGSGNYLTVQDTLTLTLASGTANYFGLWGSALDGGNTVAFYKGGALIEAINLTTWSLSDPAYYGNPNNGQDSNEKFAFFNFKVAGGYDKVTLTENGGGGFESDNHTIGTLAGGVPEPATWSLMIGGFGLVGYALRRRRAAAGALQA